MEKQQVCDTSYSVQNDPQLQWKKFPSLIACTSLNLNRLIFEIGILIFVFFLFFFL